MKKQRRSLIKVFFEIWESVSSPESSRQFDQKKIIYSIAGASLLTIWLLNAVISTKEYRMQKALEVDSLARMTEIVSEEVRSLFLKAKSDMAILDIWLQQNPKADPRFDQRFLQLVRTIEAESKNRIDIRSVSSKGELFYIPSKSTEPLALVNDREYFQAQNDERKGFYIARSVKSRVTRKWGIPVSFPVTNKNCAVSILFSVVENHILEDIFEQTRPKPDGTIALMRKDGILLCRAPFDEKLIGRNIIPNPKPVLNKDEKVTVKTLVSTKTDNRLRLVSIEKLNDLPLIISVSTPYSSAMQPFYRSVVIRTAALLFLSLVIILLTTALLRFSKNMSLINKEVTALNQSLEDRNNDLHLELQEKELIVREINHRIKNQMSQLSSLISLSKGGNQSEMIERLKGRIFNYSILYEKLTYRDSSEKKLYISPYLKDLIPKIVETYSESLSISFLLNCEDLAASPKAVNVLGLISAELITNSIKYAFSPGKENRFEIFITEEGEKIFYRYRDYGAGFNFLGVNKDESKKHLGFVLISTMVQSLNGSISYFPEKGSLFEIILNDSRE